MIEDIITRALWILMTAAGFGLLILIHEFGHFVAAKLMGVRVEAFSIGFGPNLSRRWGDTEYRFSAIPLGGYVKLAGEQREEGREPAPDEFYGRPVWQRIVVFVAGVVMNAALAVVLFAAAFTAGVEKAPAVIGYVSPGGPAWRAGLQEGDRIVSINGKGGFIEFSDVSVAALFADPNEDIALTVERKGKRLKVAVDPEYDEQSGFQRIGIAAPNTLEIGELYYVNPSTYEADTINDPENPTPAQRAGSPALAAGLRRGDRILTANGKPVHDAREVSDEIVPESGGEPIRMTYARGDEVRQTAVEPQQLGDWMIGVVCRSTTIEAVRRNSWATELPLRKGDTITAVDGEPVNALSQLKRAGESDGDVTLTVRTADGEERSIETTAARAAQIDDVVHFKQSNVISQVTPGFPVARAGLQPGDVLIQIARRGEGGEWIEQNVSTQSDLTETIRKSDGGPLRLAWTRGEHTMETELTAARRYLIGMVFKPLLIDVKLPVGEAMVFGWRKTIQWLPRFYHTIKGFFVRSVSVRHLGGPVGIVKFTYRAAQSGLGVLLYFLGIISMNLALFNLLPIPVLDGGHVLFALIEKAKGSPVSEKTQTRAAYIGLVLLVALMLVATFNDFFPKLR